MNDRAWLRATMAILAAMLVSLATAQAGRAYRALTFGDSFSTVAQKIAADDAFTDAQRRPLSASPDGRTVAAQLRLAYDMYTSVGGERYQVRLRFFDDKLYRVSFESVAYTADFFDTLVAESRDNLAAVIRTAHGAPDRTYDVGFFDMEPYHITWSQVWSTDSAGTAYYVGTGETQSQYYACLWIEWTWLREQADNAAEKREADQQSKSAEDF